MKKIQLLRPNLGHTRRTLMVAALTLAVLPSARADYASEILAENPLVYFRFDDSVVTDDSPPPEVNLGSLGALGNGYYSDTIVRQVPGALVGSPNVAGDFVGKGLSVPFNAALNQQGSFSVEVWLKPSAIPEAGGLLCPISSWRENPAEATGREGWLIYQGDDATGFNFRTYNKDGGNFAMSLTSGPGVVAGKWHHVVVTWDDAAAIGRIYVDGVLKNTSAPVVPVAPLRAFEANTISPFTIGSRSDDAFGWSGQIDEPAYYGAILSDAQVLARYHNGISAAPPVAYDSLVLADNPVGYWRLVDDYVPRTPPPAANSGTLGEAADGEYHGGAKNTATGPSTASGFLGFGGNNSALALAEANGHVSTGLSLLNGLSEYTVAGWVKRGAIHSTRGGYFGQNDVLEFGDSAVGVNIEAYISPRGSIHIPYSAADDSWCFIVLTADSTQATLYLDGVAIDRTTNGGTVTHYPSSTDFFNIGGGGVFNPSGDYFRGEIDEVAVFDKAMTAGRVKQLYDAALGTALPEILGEVPTISPIGDILEGLPFTLAVDATGTPPLTYQWLLDGVPIPGATDSSYTVPAAAARTPDPYEPYSYTVKVTNGNGSTTSGEVYVNVTQALRWASPAGPQSGKWDIYNLNPSPLNWKTFTGGTLRGYEDDFAVVFDDSADSTSVELTQEVWPRAVRFENSTKDYTLTGDFAVRDSTGHPTIKSGTGNVVLANAVYEVENLQVNEGKLQIGDGTTGTLGDSTKVRINGGEFAVNVAPGSAYSNATTLTGGLLTFTGAGNLAMSAPVSGPGDLLFDRDGTVTVRERIDIGGAVTIRSGVTSFDGAQNANRLPARKEVTVEAGGTMEVLGVNALPTGGNSITAVLNQGTVRVVSGGSPAIGEEGSSHAHIHTLTMDGGEVILSYSGKGYAYHSESFQLNGDINVVGSSPSTIRFGSGASPGNSGIAVSTQVEHVFNVENVAVGPDLIISAELENSDSSDPTSGVISKTGAGTLLLDGGIHHSFTGSTLVNEGSFQANGSLAGPVVVATGAVIEPGPTTETLTLNRLTLDGTYVCEINGASSDRLIVQGDGFVGGSGKIVISTLAGGATAPVYDILTTTGTLSGTPVITGVPNGYEVVVTANLIRLIQSNLDLQPKLASYPASGSEDFNTTPGGFTVSAPVSPQTDWTYQAGAWSSYGTDDIGGATHTSYLISPVYTVSAAGPVSISFSHNYRFEQNYDAGALEISINGGEFTPLPGSAFTLNGYDGLLATVTNSALAGKEGFLGFSAGYPAYITSIATLVPNASVGTTVQVRFMGAYDDAYTDGGWKIDSFEITNALPNLMSLSWPLGTMQYSDDLQPPWIDLPYGSPLLIDTKAAPKRFFRLKP